ncbi:polysaccharide deacetylase family protein [Alphaproteobacteria bacterium]|nr:polysaccharide deacetylase family protein [Alphaproteobacteria bacterium]
MNLQPYGPFPYRPLHEAPPLTWPNGARVALVIVPNVEFFPLNLPIPGTRPNIPDVSAWGRRDYGNRVGFFRMADIMARLGIRGTVALNSMACDYCPQVVEKCLELDWELMGHGETNSILLSDYNTEDESADCIVRTLDRIEAFCGKRPRGWLGPGRQQTWNTLDVIADEGCTYTFDWDNDDQPVLMEVNGKPIVSMPYGAGVSDLQAFHFMNASPTDFTQMITDAFNVLHRESEKSGRVVGISLHPFIIGLPHRIGALERGLEYVCRHDDVWLATAEEVTDSFLQQQNTN